MRLLKFLQRKLTDNSTTVQLLIDEKLYTVTSDGHYYVNGEENRNLFGEKISSIYIFDEILIGEQIKTLHTRYSQRTAHENTALFI